MELHFAVRLLIVVIAFLAPILWQWRTTLAPSHAVTVRCSAKRVTSDHHSERIGGHGGEPAEHRREIGRLLPRLLPRTIFDHLTD
jgi:hypothetical protein